MKSQFKDRGHAAGLESSKEERVPVWGNSKVSGMHGCGFVPMSV